MELDRFDKQILEILTHEDVNLNELSERISLSVSSVHRRIKHLIETNIMSSLKRDINFAKLGFTLHILLQVSLSKHDTETFDKFLTEIEDIPEVTNAFLVTGQSADFILELVARNMDDYSDILLRRIGKIDNVVALRGDAVKSEIYFKPEKEGHAYASELVTQISNLNKGIYLDEDLQNSTKTDFCIGVAGYPEKHMEAPSLDSDIHFVKQKIKNGADYIITQMFFDNKKFFDFVAKCRAAGITVPIIPGLKPIATKKQLNLIPHRFSVELPDDLIMAVVKAKDNDAVKQIGIEWCTQQSKELVAAGIPVLHYYSMGKAENVKAIAKEIF